MYNTRLLSRINIFLASITPVAEGRSSRPRIKHCPLASIYHWDQHCPAPVVYHRYLYSYIYIRMYMGTTLVSRKAGWKCPTGAAEGSRDGQVGQGGTEDVG